MKRILIFGGPGSGKSTLAARLGAKLHLPVFHIDKLFWLPGWVERPKPEVAADIEKVLAMNDAWVIDGNFKKLALESRLRLADTVIILDFGRPTRFYRVLKRNLIHWNKTRPDMQEGCPEKRIPDITFMKYVWRYRNHTLLPIMEIIKGYSGKKIVICTNRKEVDVWLENLT